MFKTLTHLGATLTLALLVVAPVAFAADAVEVLIAIKNNRFEPAEVRVPANQRVKLIVHNQDASPEEFESRQLSREKIVPAGAKVSIFIGPLKPGRYEFWGEYHEATAKGVVIAE
ncbi:MAG: cupredoxin domain-containing protein [Caldimonas sp.]